MKKVIIVIFMAYSFSISVYGAVPFTGIWANDGSDKIFQEDRPMHDGLVVTNSHWDGNEINIAGARNEVVEFNLMLEGSDTTVITNISVSFKKLMGPYGYELKSKSVSGDGVFDYVDREIELFLVGYVRWSGISGLGFSETAGQACYPEQFRYDYSLGTRPNWLKHIPEIAYPIELYPTFNIETSQQQAVWCDIYIPNNAPAGDYSGNVIVRIGEVTNAIIPVALKVRKMRLPNTFNVKTMLFFEGSTLKSRFSGTSYWDASRDEEYKTICNNIRKLVQRHRITLSENHGFRTHRFMSGNIYDVDNKSWNLDPDNDSGVASWESDLTNFYKPYFTGEMFDRAHGYEGPGAGHGGDVFAIYQYFATPVRSLEPNDVNGPDGSGELYPYSKRFLVDWAPNWCKWFAENAPNVNFFYYVRDEDFRTVAWDNDLGQQLDALPDVSGQKKMRIFKTSPILKYMMKDFPSGDPKSTYRPEYGEYETVVVRDDGSSRVRVIAPSNFPAIDIWTFPMGGYMMPEDRWKTSYDAGFKVADHDIWPYNGGRPTSPCFMTDGGGTDLRALEWMDEKFGFGRHFYFMGNLWWNFFGGTEQRYLNFWEDAHTHGMASTNFTQYSGYKGWNFANGDGVLFYPGKDYYYPEHSCGLNGAIASLRLKFWRRGIQDAEYIRMARKADPAAVESIIKTVIPRGCWETPYASEDEPFWFNDPTYVGWSERADDYAGALDKLAVIIESRIPGAVIFINGQNPAINHPPTVYAGTDKFITLPVNSIELAGAASDLDGDGLTINWTTVSGTGTVSFADSTSVTSVVQFSDAGAYVLSLSVDDGVNTPVSDTVRIIVNPEISATIMDDFGTDTTTNYLYYTGVDNYGVPVITNGVMYGQLWKQTLIFHKIMLNNNHYVEADLNPYNGSEGCGLVVRGDVSAGNGYYCFISASGLVELDYLESVDRHWITGYSGGYTNGPYRMRMEADGTTIRVFINGNKVIDRTDTRYQIGGRIGVKFTNSGLNSWIDNLVAD